MNISIIYFVCFLISIIILIIAFERGENYSPSQVLFMMVMALGNGGYFAMALSKNLEEAILANKLTYVIGIFSPMLLFFVICEICGIEIRRSFRMILLSFQVLLYLSVCSIEMLPIFYKNAAYNTIDGIAYLTKTYGPLHNFYIVSLAAYLVATIVVVASSLRHKNRVSAKDIDTIIILESLTIACYVLERISSLTLELLPIADTITLIFLFITITKLQTYSIMGNRKLISRKISSSGYMVFDNKLRYMGCNEFAARFFPELTDWEREKKIPGSGGRFNTFIRQQFMAYTAGDGSSEEVGKPFEIHGQRFICTYDSIRNRGGRKKGYIIEVSDITTLVDNGKTDM